MIFRLLQKEDVPQCIELANTNWDHDLECIEYDLRSSFEPDWWGRQRFIVLVNDLDTIIAFGGYSMSYIDYDCYIIQWVNVRKEYRGCNYGTTLVQEIIRNITNEPHRKSDITILLSCKKPLIRMYKRIGFKVLLRKKNTLEVVMGMNYLV